VSPNYFYASVASRSQRGFGLRACSRKATYSHHPFLNKMRLQLKIPVKPKKDTSLYLGDIQKQHNNCVFEPLREILPTQLWRATELNSQTTKIYLFSPQ